MSSIAVMSLTQVGSFREEVEVESVKTGGGGTLASADEKLVSIRSPSLSVHIIIA